MAEGLGELLVNQGLDKGLLVEQRAKAIDDNWGSEWLRRKSAGGPARETSLVGIDLVRLFHRVHIEVAVAGLGSGGTAIAAAAAEAEAEGEGRKEGGGDWG